MPQALPYSTANANPQQRRQQTSHADGDIHCHIGSETTDHTKASTAAAAIATHNTSTIHTDPQLNQYPHLDEPGSNNDADDSSRSEPAIALGTGAPTVSHCAPKYPSSQMHECNDTTGVIVAVSGLVAFVSAGAHIVPR